MLFLWKMPDLVDVYNAVPDLYCFDELRGAPRTPKKTFLLRVRTMMRFLVIWARLGSKTSI